MYRSFVFFIFTYTFAHAQTKPEVEATLAKALSYYHDKVASHGGYVYYYSPDLNDRWGEGKYNEDTIFVQPPGTPSIGQAYLAAYKATKNDKYLSYAKDTTKALCYGQLESGGWTPTIHFAKVNRMGKYRNGKGGNWNASSLDDDQTQAALSFLIAMDQALNFKDAEIHDAAEYGLKALLNAQFANGGFPQIWQKPVADYVPKAAKYPEYNWKTEGRVKNYWDYYTLNDGLCGTVLEVLLLAQEVYKDDKSKAAIKKLGDFLILAQMPEPQPGWCQQYNYDMVPIWARKFEPPAITGWESQDAMRTLIRIANYTKDPKYLAPLSKALEYFKKSLLMDGQVARYYELKSNKPLYMNARYELTYDDAEVPNHYGWKQSAKFNEIEKQYELAKKGEAEKPKANPNLNKDVRVIVDSLDKDGRWITTYKGDRLVGQPKFADGFQYISSTTFHRNVMTLCEFLGQ